MPDNTIPDTSPRMESDGARRSEYNAIDGIAGAKNQGRGCKSSALIDESVSPATSDFPLPPAAMDHRPFIWNADSSAVALYPRFAERLNQVGDVYRLPGYGSG